MPPAKGDLETNLLVDPPPANPDPLFQTKGEDCLLELQLWLCVMAEQVDLPIPPSGKAYSFQCPQCGASLLAALPEKLTAVGCDECGHVFLAQVCLLKVRTVTACKL